MNQLYSVRKQAMTYMQTALQCVLRKNILKKRSACRSQTIVCDLRLVTLYSWCSLEASINFDFVSLYSYFLLLFFTSTLYRFNTSMIGKANKNEVVSHVNAKVKIYSIKCEQVKDKTNTKKQKASTTKGCTRQQSTHLKLKSLTQELCCFVEPFVSFFSFDVCQFCSAPTCF